MGKLSKVKIRMLSFVLSLCMVMVGVIIAAVPQKVEAATISGIDTTKYYYIKNVRSNKFLTVQQNIFDVGQNLVQWNFTGQNNQKWKFEYSNGYYKLCAYNTNLVISMASSSSNVGVTAKLATKSNDGKQLFKASDMLGNGSYRFKTFSSGESRVLLANGASIYNNTYIVQGNQGGQWNDQWLIESVNHTSSGLNVNYGRLNNDHRLATYPDFDYYTGYNKRVNEATNFVSQCLTADGYNYYRQGTATNWWYVNKLQHIQNDSFDFNELTNNWGISTTWYDPTEFKRFWVQIQGSPTVNISDARFVLTQNSNQLNNKMCFVGDVIILKKNSQIIDLLYCENFKFGTDLVYCIVDRHLKNGLTRSTLGNILATYSVSSSSDYSLEIIHIGL